MLVLCEVPTLDVVTQCCFAVQSAVLGKFQTNIQTHVGLCRPDAAQPLFRLAAVVSQKRRAIDPAAKVSTGFAHQGVDSSAATPLHVSVTETELRNIAKNEGVQLAKGVLPSPVQILAHHVVPEAM